MIDTDGRLRRVGRDRRWVREPVAARIVVGGHLRPRVSDNSTSSPSPQPISRARRIRTKTVPPAIVPVLYMPRLSRTRSDGSGESLTSFCGIGARVIDGLYCAYLLRLWLLTMFGVL